MRLSSQGSTPLYFASRRGHLSIVSELLKHKPRLRGKTYETDPLAASQTERKAEVSVALLRAGYPVLEKHGGKDVFLYDAYGQTPFHNALILQVRHTHLTALRKSRSLRPSGVSCSTHWETLALPPCLALTPLFSFLVLSPCCRTT